jgi:hypothetical protein
MALFGLVTAFLAAVAVDLLGNEATRAFTRRAFAAVVVLEMGLTLQHVVEAGAIITNSLPV